MQRRAFFKLVGAAAAVAAVPAFSACSAVSTPSAEGTGVLGQPAVSFSASVDVLILGSGVAGLSAAMDPAEAGLSVMVAEKLDVLGGESYESNAVMDVVGSKVQKDAGITESCDDVWPSRRETLRAAGVTDLEFAKRLFYAAPEWVDRMRDSYGAQFDDPATYTANEANRRRVLPKNGIGDTESIMMPLRDRLSSKGVQFSTGYCASAFILDEDNHVCGVRFVTGKEAPRSLTCMRAPWWLPRAGSPATRRWCATICPRGNAWGATRLRPWARATSCARRWAPSWPTWPLPRR